MSEYEQVLSLGELISEVERAARGNLALGTHLSRITEQLSRDAQAPEEARTLAVVLRQILAGERNPDLSALPEEFSDIIQGMLGDLLEDERSRKPEDASPDQDEEEGLTLDELLGLVERAVKGDQRLGTQLFSLAQQMSGDASLDESIRALAQVLMLIMAGNHQPDLNNLPPQLRGPVSQMLQNLNAGS